MAVGDAKDFRVTSTSSATQRKRLFPVGPTLKCVKSGADTGTSQSQCPGGLEVLLVRPGDGPTPGARVGGGSFLKESQAALIIERKRISPCTAGLSFFPEFLGRNKMTGLNLPSSENMGGRVEERGLGRPS